VIWLLLEDAYVNFVFSCFVEQEAEALGREGQGSVLAEALRKAGLRDCLGSVMSRHGLAVAAEALIVYAWLNCCITLDESVAIMRKGEDVVEGASELLATARKRVTFP
jgi:hypothetical protein